MILLVNSSYDMYTYIYIYMHDTASQFLIQIVRILTSADGHSREALSLCQPSV